MQKGCHNHVSEFASLLNIYTHLWWKQQLLETEGRAGVLLGSVHTANLPKKEKKKKEIVSKYQIGGRTEMNKKKFSRDREILGNRQLIPCGGSASQNVSLCADERVKCEREWGQQALVIWQG